MLGSVVTDQGRTQLPVSNLLANNTGDSKRTSKDRYSDRGSECGS